jgi:DNA-directed RNA polymerase
VYDQHNLLITDVNIKQMVELIDLCILSCYQVNKHDTNCNDSLSSFNRIIRLALHILSRMLYQPVSVAGLYVPSTSIDGFISQIYFTSIIGQSDLSPIMNDFRGCNKSNMTGVTSGSETAYPFIKLLW